MRVFECRPLRYVGFAELGRRLIMTRGALAFSIMLAGFVLAAPASAQTTNAGQGAQPKPGQTCKKI